MYIRKQRKAILIYCEGETCEIFFKHLNKLYYAKGKNYRVKFEHTRGNATTLFRQLKKRFNEFYAYSIIIVVYDVDIEIKQNLISSIERLYNGKIFLIPCKPCLEAFFLEILHNKTCSNDPQCKRCKSIFRKNYIKKKHQTDRKAYERIFTKELLDKRSKDKDRIAKILTKIIKILSGNI